MPSVGRSGETTVVAVHNDLVRTTDASRPSLRQPSVNHQLMLDVLQHQFVVSRIDPHVTGSAHT